jgi:hypothetical protein
MLNLMNVSVGQQLEMRGGAICEVVENMGDGICVQARVVKNDADPETVGDEELIHCEDVIGLAKSSS